MKSLPLRIAPSMLAADFGRLTQQISEAEKGGADLIHCDVMDGIFVPNLTFGPGVIRALRSATDIPLDVHLMIVKPELSMQAYADAGAAIITIHQEASVHLHRTLAEIRRMGIQAGVALNPSTPVATIEPVVEEIDLLLIMTVNPGFGGQQFIEACLRKVEEAHALRERSGLDFSIEVDGGIEPTTIGRIARAGADTFVAGTAVFNGEIAKNIQSLRQAAQKERL
jgi:ribulose-phosphate 3-epimerase